MFKVAVLLCGMVLVRGAEPASSAVTSVTRTHVLRLRPGADLVDSIRSYASPKHIRAARVSTIVGSLKSAKIRYADQSGYTALDGKFEIVSAVGMIDPAGGHLHLSVSDGSGKTLGGHVGSGCIVYTTAEVVLTELPDLTFTREKDKDSGYNELVVR